MGSLGGIRVALLESRLSSELARLVRRFGGEPVCVPAVQERAIEAPVEVAAFIDWLGRDGKPLVVFLTGVGTTALFEQAGGVGRRAELAERLASATTVCRGPKPAGALQRAGVSVSVNVREPYTTTELLEALAGIQVNARGVGIVHYGERSTPLADALRARGADLRELLLYEWRLPEDREPLERLIGDLIAGRLEAIAFTSQVQARHLFAVADQLGCSATLARALNDRLIVAAVGPTCAAGLAGLGVTPQVIPEHPKMGHLVRSLANQVEANHRARDRVGGRSSGPPTDELPLGGHP